MANIRNRTARILTEADHHYAVGHALVVRQETPSPMQQGLLEDATTLQIRRVVPTGGTEELQIEITIQKFGLRRTTSHHVSFIAPPEIADAIGRACLECRK